MNEKTKLNFHAVNVDGDTRDESQCAVRAEPLEP